MLETLKLSNHHKLSLYEMVEENNTYKKDYYNR